MNKKKIARESKDIGFSFDILYPQAFAMALTVQVFPAKPGRYCTSYTFRDPRYRPDCCL